MAGGAGSAAVLADGRVPGPLEECWSLMRTGAHAFYAANLHLESSRKKGGPCSKRSSRVPWTIMLPDERTEHIAGMAAGYSSGLKWNEEDKLKADMTNRPGRWALISVEQVRAKCRELGMRPNDVDTVAGYLQRRKDGRRFNVRSSYRDFQFN